MGLAADLFTRHGRAVESTRPFLHKLIGVIVRSMGRYEDGSQELKSLGYDLNKAYSVETSAIEQTILNMNQIERANASHVENSASVLDMAYSGQEKSAQGLHNASVLNKAMKDIQETCEALNQVREIISSMKQNNQVINKIVSQLRLLSLNATIEATRAGAQGLGFAVVADEVRRLAETSGSASRGIGSLLDAGVSKVEETIQLILDRISKGNRAAVLCTESFHTIDSTIGQLMPRIEAIASATHGQKKAVERTVSVMRQLEVVNRMNAGLLSQIEQVSSLFAKEAESLEDVLLKSVDAAMDPALQEEVARELRYNGLLKAVSFMASQTMDLKSLFKLTLDQICKNTDWPIGHVLTPENPSSDVLRSALLWHIDGPAGLEDFKKASESTPFPPGIGLPGRVYQQRAPAWIVDVQEDPNFPRAKLVQNLSVRGAFAFPIIMEDKVIAVLEFFSNKAIRPDEKLLELLGLIGFRLGRVYQRRKTVEDIAALTNRMGN